MTIRLIITDDHPMILKGMENLFQAEKDFELVARCTSGKEALAALRRYQPDVAIMNLRMPGEDGLEITRKLVAEKLPTRIILYTAEINEDQLLEAIRIGVKGIVLKEMEPRLLVLCIRKVHAGEQWIERRTARLSLEKLLRREAGAIEIASLLTLCESNILKIAVQGLTNHQIADKLCISEGTVKVHMHNIYDKLQVKSRFALLHYAQEKCLL